MASCTRWVTQVVTTCKNWGADVRSECAQWADEGSSQCSQWADEGSSQCSQWADEGSSQCSQWADEGSSQCSDWEECHWYTPWNCVAGFFCNAWYWVANWVCQAWYWVANWVCQAWYWVANWVCQAWYWVANIVCVVFTWVVTVVCVAFSIVMAPVCVAWDTARCASTAIQRRRRSTEGPAIEHVFVLMLENRSFDHVFGFSGLAGVDPDGNPTTANGADPVRDSNVDPITGASVPVTDNPPADFALKGVDPDPGHEFHDTMVSLCGTTVANGWAAGSAYPSASIDCSGFIANYADDVPPAAVPPRIMRCFTKQQLPVLNKLAEEFAVCDAWFSSMPGPTWPNRFFLVAASTGGLDDSPSKADIVSATTVDGYRFANGTIFDLLDDACIDWAIYEGDEFPVSYAISGMALNALQGRFHDFDDFESDLAKKSFGPKFVFIEPKYGAHRFDITGPGDFTCGNSMHALDDVTRGEALVKQVYEAIRNSPHWEKSVLLIVFDEHGGFYDHVVPPAAVPPGDTITQNYVKTGFGYDQLGVRVPALVISPLIPKGVIDHTVYDHTSMLATVERLFGLPHLTERDKAAADFMQLFSLSTPRTDAPAALPAPSPNLDNPLDCGGEDDTPAESQDALLGTRSELRQAQRRGVYGDRATAEFPVTSTQVGFAQVALLRVLAQADAVERRRWVEQYEAIATGIDAALFMTDAKLRLVHGLDVKRWDPPEPTKRNPTRGNVAAR